MKERPLYREQQVEGRENKVQAFFIHRFYIKLQEAIEEHQRSNSTFDNEEIGKLVKDKIVAESVAVVFRGPSGNDPGGQQGLNIWLENLEYYHGGMYPHDVAKLNLKDFLNLHGISTEPRSYKGYVLIDKNAGTHLCFESPESVERGIDKNATRPEEQAEWIDLMRRYGISTLIGNFDQLVTFPDGEQFIGRKPKVIVGEKDLVAEKREENFLRTFSEKYGMNATQYLRFHLRAKASMEAMKEQVKDSDEGNNFNYSIDLDKLAKEVIAQEQQEGHL